ALLVVLLGGAPADSAVTGSVVPVCRSWTNTSVAPFESPATRSVASLSNATKRPSAERAGPKLALLPSVPPEATLTRSVVPAPPDCPQRAVVTTVAAAPRIRRG